MSWLFQGHSLSINVSVPLTPFRSKKGSYKPVNKVLLKLWYWLHLYDGEVLTQQVRGRGGGHGQKGHGACRSSLVQRGCFGARIPLRKGW